MEDPTFSDKIEEYFSELGRWLVFRIDSIVACFINKKCINLIFWFQEGVAEYSFGTSFVVAAQW